MKKSEMTLAQSTRLVLVFGAIDKITLSDAKSGSHVGVLASTQPEMAESVAVTQARTRRKIYQTGRSEN